MSDHVRTADLLEWCRIPAAQLVGHPRLRVPFRIVRDSAEMGELIDTNPGLKSRFTRTINFPDYTDDELVAIFVKLGERNQYLLTDDALAAVRHHIGAEPRTRGFGNARYVRNLFETAIAHQAMRLAPLSDPSDEQLTTLTGADIAPVDA